MSDDNLTPFQEKFTLVQKNAYYEIYTSDGSDPFTTGLTSIRVIEQPKLTAWSHPVDGKVFDNMH